ncbi:hypothetical protein H9P43_002121 [Blastocladiella emersonii ATCC 22665]|nr:hypothetical protein H9P43_002121 [Blastocladiella emersonii ATCC 22665]
MGGKQKKVKGDIGLGKTLIRKRFQGNRPQDGDTTLHTTEVSDGPSWTKLQSVTHEGDLQEILYTAELAGTEFTAERLNIKVITQDSSGVNPFLLTEAQEKETLQRHADMRERLTVPRRPHWDETTTAEELQRSERESFLDWRRGLAELQEDHGLLLTPFERNLEVWRQLWRVIERSDVIVQIVDARNPLFFRSTDLEQYVREVDPRKKNILLVNKADMLTRDQRKAWAVYFESQGIRFSFFSAALAKRANDEEELRSTEDEAKQLELQLKMATLGESDNLLLDADNVRDDADLQTTDTPSGAKRDPLRILTTSDLLDLFTSECPEPLRKDDPRTGGRVTVGLVGYPNVGKSSTINALCGSKVVSVSATPGKTKHFQTLNLTDKVMLCDCPGLVFPSFATTQADMVCNGVLPIDQMREASAPSALVAQRIPKDLIERIYGIRVKVYDDLEVGRTIPTGEELAKAYALARGFMRQGQGNPDESRAARYLLKDYNRGKLVFVHPPPTFTGTPAEFNAILHAKLLSLCTKKPPPPLGANMAIGGKRPAISAQPRVNSSKSQNIDTDFFGQTQVRAMTMGKHASGDYARSSLGRGVDLAGSARGGVPEPTGKKSHKKGKKNQKVRIPVRDE